jgi:hypothetical protein
MVVSNAGNVGIGTTTPGAKLDVAGDVIVNSGTTTSQIVLNSTGSLFALRSIGTDNTFLLRSNSNGYQPIIAYSDTQTLSLNGNIGINKITPTARLQIVGSGATSATTSLLVQNSAGTQTTKIQDDGVCIFGTSNYIKVDSTGQPKLIWGETVDRIAIQRSGGNAFLFSSLGTEFASLSSGGSVFGSNTLNASAMLQADSTTKGFLPPQMSTTQKNAIASPAAGLMVYDTTLNKLCVRTAAAWETITSI